MDCGMLTFIALCVGLIIGFWLAENGPDQPA